MALIDLGRAIANDLAAGTRREWLVTNGLGSYASGTVTGILTRSYHGLLVAALDPPLGRTLLWATLDATVVYDGRAWPLFAHRWQAPDGPIDPTGHRDIERFRLEGTAPVWTYVLGDAQLEKRIWMEPGADTTYVRFDLVRGSGPIELRAKPLVNRRDHHATTRADDEIMSVEPVESGLRVDAFGDATPLYLLSAGGSFEPDHEWHRSFFLTEEAVLRLGVGEGIGRLGENDGPAPRPNENAEGDEGDQRESDEGTGVDTHLQGRCLLERLVTGRRDGYSALPARETSSLAVVLG